MMKRLAPLWSVLVLAVAVVGLAVALALSITLRPKFLVGPSNPIVRITAVNGNKGVCTSQGCFVAFVSGQAVEGHRYYAREFFIPLTGGGHERAILLLPYPLPGGF